MLSLHGYTIIEELAAISISTDLFIAQDNSNQRVLVKRFKKQEYKNTLGKFKRTNEQLSHLKINGILKPSTINEDQQFCYAIFPLANNMRFLADIITQDKLSIEQQLNIALKLNALIGDIHQHNFVINHLCTTNILIDDKGNAFLYDLSHASQISSIHKRVKSNVIQPQYLATISPEASGRMNSPVEQYSDFYALGSIYYRLFTGQYPFQIDDQMELLHAHLAKKPPAASTINMKLPSAISRIIDKLLEKAPYQRYNSAQGLLADLTLCLDALQNSGTIPQFTLGLEDIQNRLTFSRKLFGREEELRTLLNAYDTACRLKTIQLCVVSGYSGVGKSRLIHEIEQKVSKDKGFFVTGKYEQYKNSTAYFALSTALTELVELILCENTEQLANWRQTFEQALGDNSQLIIDLVPEFSMIIESTPPLAEVSPAQAHTRFINTFVNFFRAIAMNNRSITIFIDDMQWADLATIELLKALLEQPELEGLYFIIAYRDNEVETTHPLTHFLNNIDDWPAFYSHIKVSELSEQALSDFIADSLQLPSKGVEDLASTIINKTQGNPFFTIEFIKALHNAGILYKDKANNWCWQLEDIINVDATENVLTLMAARIQRLPDALQDILYTAACIGTVANVELLQHIKPIDDIPATLQPLVAEGFISVIVDEQKNSVSQIRFSHDKIQQAAYQLNRPTHKTVIHYQVAKYYLDNQSADNIDSNIFNYIEHLNIAATHFMQHGQRLTLTQTNLEAGEKALEANANVDALHYFNVALNHVDNTDWESNYAIRAQLSIGKAKACYLTQEYEQCNENYEQALPHIKSIEALTELTKVQIMSLIAQNNMTEAYSLGVEILQELGVVLPSEDDIGEYYLSIERYYDDKPIELLIELPKIRDNNAVISLEILNTIQTPAYLISPNAFMCVAYASLELFFTKGASAGSSKVLVTHALLLCGAFSKFHEGQTFANLASAINEKYPSPYTQTETEFTKNVSVMHWNKHIDSTLVPLEANFYHGIENGNIEYAFHSALFYCFHYVFSGKKLSKVSEVYKKYTELMANKRQGYQLMVSQIWQQFAFDLQKEKPPTHTLRGDAFNETQSLGYLEETNNVTTLFSYHQAKMILAHLFGDRALSFEHLVSAEPLSSSAVSLYHFAEFYFYAGLVLARRCRDINTPEEEKQLAKEKLATYLNMITLWAEHAPENHLHKQKLLEAELAALNDAAEAWQLYDEAIAAARKNHFSHHLAFALEHCGEYWLAQDKQAMARDYLQQAYEEYLAWGATAKAEQLVNIHPKLLEFTQNGQLVSLSQDKSRNASQVLDLASVLKASATLSSEGNLHAFLHRMMVIIMENAGAQKGALLMQTDGILNVEIAVSNDGLAVQDRDLPYSIINFVSRTLKPQAIADIHEHKRFSGDDYFKSNHPKSIMCFPSIIKGVLKGVVYLEHYDLSQAFSSDRVNILQLLADQTAISFDNAKLYQQVVSYNKNLEQQIHERTKELAAEKIKAEQASQAKSNFLANMSHEIRTPMNAVIGLSQLALRHETSPTQKDYLEKIQDSSRSLLGLINDILDFSKIEAEKMTLEKVTFSIHDLMQRVVNVCTYKVHEKGIELVVDIHPNVPNQLMGDPLRLQQIIINLANNAVKFTDKGAIHIKIGLSASSTTDCELLFSVRDTGIGMSQEQQDRLFQSFSQADDSVTRKYGGTGLGLAISKQLTELMGGKIWVESDEGVGSTFSFTVVLAEAPKEVERLSQMTRKSLANLRVLVADDIDIARKVLIDALAHADIHADGVENGEQALTRVLHAEQIGQPYDLVLMDWKMPKMDGIEAAKQIQIQSQGQIPHILMVSAYDKDEAKREALDAGIHQFIEKPINQSTLLDSIVEIISQSSNHIAVEYEQPVSEVPDLSKYSVLLVEDNLINQQVAMEFLSDTKIQITCAENGKIAIEKLKQTTFDIVLMDIQMPEMDGLTATTIIRKELGLDEIPIIAMTAHAMEGDIEKSVIAGMNQHLTKPIEPDLLFSTLQQYLETEPSTNTAEETVTELDAEIEQAQLLLEKLAAQTSLAVDEAITKVQGKQKLYLQLVHDFWEKHQQLSENIVDMYKTNATEDLYRAAHSLKSTAQYIGAYELSASAAAVESEIKLKGLQVELKLNELTTQIDYLIAQLNRIYRENNDNVVNEELDVEAAQAIILKLKPLVVSADIQAEESSKQLHDLANHTPYFDDVKQLHRLISNFDFEEAQTALTTLEATLKTQQEQITSE